MEDLEPKPVSPNAEPEAAAVNIVPAKSKVEYVNIFDSEKDQRFIEGDGKPMTTKDLYCFAFQIARGMEYLSGRKVSLKF